MRMSLFEIAIFAARAGKTVQKLLNTSVSVRFPRSDGEMECLLDVHHG